MKKKIFSFIKRYWLVVLILSLALFFFYPKAHVNKHAPVTLTFACGENDIRVTLEKEEATAVSKILNGTKYNPRTGGTPACGYGRDVTIRVGGRVFAVAQDSCNCLFDFGALRYLDIPQTDIEYIHQIFEKYGGYFPCI